MARRRSLVPSRLRPVPVRIEPEAARSLVARGASLVDARLTENPAAPLEGAFRIPPGELPERLGELPRGAPVVLACT